MGAFYQPCQCKRCDHLLVDKWQAEAERWKALAGELKHALQSLTERDGVGEFIAADEVLTKAREAGL